MSKLISFATFISVAENSSFSRAAGELRKSPSAITKIINQLEKELGTQLFIRDTRHTVITEAGKLYLEAAKGILQSLKNTSEEVSQLQSEIGGSLRIAAPVAYGRAFLDDACAEFQDKHPTIQMIMTLVDTPISMSEGGYDLSLRAGNTESSIVRPVGRNFPYVCASPDYLNRVKYPINHEFAHKHEWMNMVNPAITKEYWEAKRNGVVYRFGAGLKPKVISNNYDFLLGQAIRGQALLIVPQWCANPLLKSGKLVKVMEDYEICTNPFGSHIVGVYPEYRRSSRKVISFLDHLQTYLKEHDLD